MLIDWLTALLEERFGLRFLVSEVGKTYRLSLDGLPGQIILDRASADFTCAPADLPCHWWDAAAEGWKAPVSARLPAPGASGLRDPLIDRVGDGHTIGYDILGLMAWALSRVEEVERTDLDEHGRFPATASHAFRHEYLERPVVDEWLVILSQVIERQWTTLRVKRHQFDFKVSHDVDRPGAYAFLKPKEVVRRMGGDLLVRRDWRNAIKVPLVRWRSRRRLDPADPYNTFAWIQQASETHGLKSAFYFICGRTNPAMDAQYEVEDPAIRDLMRGMHGRGHEVGLHPSYETYLMPDEIQREAQRLRTVCAQEGIVQSQWAGRMHYLRWRHPTTMLAWEAAGMAYDSSLSYADRPGFRCGTCFEYPAFDPVANRRLALRIRPLIAMEATVMADKYLGLDTGASAFEKFRQLKSTCRAVSGCFTLLWHNSELDTEHKRQLYLRVLSC